MDKTDCLTLAGDLAGELGRLSVSYLPELTNWMNDLGLGKKDYKAIYVVNTEVVNYPNPESKYSLTCPTPKKLSGYKVQVTST